MKPSPHLRGAVLLVIGLMLVGAWRMASLVSSAPEPASLKPLGISVPIHDLATPHLQPSFGHTPATEGSQPVTPGLPPAAGDAPTAGGPGAAADLAAGEPAGALRPRAELLPQAPAQTVLVHIAGHVAEPGVYYLAEGARVVDALAAAGDVLDPRVVDHLNLARRLYDEDRLYVPSWAEIEELLAAGIGGWQPYGEADAGGPVDLNRASAEALQRLPGVGPSLAERIVESRRLDGPFRSVAEAVRVPGIGPRTVEQWEGLAVAR